MVQRLQKVPYHQVPQDTQESLLYHLKFKLNSDMRIGYVMVGVISGVSSYLWIQHILGDQAHQVVRYIQGHPDVKIGQYLVFV